MLKGDCIHPELISALLLLGHGDKILIADGNYPLASRTGDARKIWLGIRPGLPTVDDVLETVLTVVNVESAQVMDPGDGSTPEIFGLFQTALDGMKLERLERYRFYEVCGERTLRLAVSTGERRKFANILLTVGTV